MFFNCERLPFRKLYIAVKMVKSHCVRLLLIAIYIGYISVIVQSRSSPTVGGVIKSIRSEVQNLMAHIVQLENLVENPYTCMSYSIEEIKRHMQAEHNDTRAQITRLENRLERRNIGLYNFRSEPDEEFESGHESELETEGMERNEHNGTIQELHSTQCPNGFNYWHTTHGFQKCYALLRKPTDWNNAQETCRQLHNDAQLVVINEASEQRYIVGITGALVCPRTQNRFPDNKTDGVMAYWIGARRRDISDCNSTFEWTSINGTTFPMHYSNWAPGEPSCSQRSEACTSLNQYHQGYMWNDLICTWSACPLCEVKFNA